MKFIVIKNRSRPPVNGKNTFYLHIDRWDDFNFRTTFDLLVHDEEGKLHIIGSVKIAKKKQTEEEITSTLLKSEFEKLEKDYYSLGQSENYYLNLMKLSPSLREFLCKNLNDLVDNSEFINEIKDDSVFSTSILREVSLTSINGQYSRILNGLALLTDFDFYYSFKKNEFDENKNFHFVIKANSNPRSNIHAVIGRNGVGKTTFLNNIISSIISPEKENYLFDENADIFSIPLSKTYFSSLISVSYSAFDPFDPPLNRVDPSKGTKYCYVGLKNGAHLKSPCTIKEELVKCIAS